MPEDFQTEMLNKDLDCVYFLIGIIGRAGLLDGFISGYQ